MMFDAVILAGGSAERLGGTAKSSLVVGGASLLERALAAVGGARRIVCVGPERPTLVPVTWTREEPAGGGPVAGLGAGLRFVEAEIVVVLAVDHPFVSGELVRRLVDACGSSDAAMVRDGSGRDQPLVAAYRTEGLRGGLARLGDLHGRAIKELVDGLDRVTVEDERAGTDIDTAEDLERARRSSEKG